MRLGNKGSLENNTRLFGNDLLCSTTFYSTETAFVSIIFIWTAKRFRRDCRSQHSRVCQVEQSDPQVCCEIACNSTHYELVLLALITDQSHVICSFLSVLFCSLAVLDPRVGHTKDVLSPHFSLPSVILTDSSTQSSVHVLMLSIQAVRGLPRLRAPGIVPHIISFSRQLPCFLML